AHHAQARQTRDRICPHQGNGPCRRPEGSAGQRAGLGRSFQWPRQAHQSRPEPNCWPEARRRQPPLAL
ncbi:MAG: hypothetical protein AVDCRST_MAG71-1137, partial [uncultured Lysobacter sp.]